MKLLIPEGNRFSTSEVIQLNKIRKWDPDTYRFIEQQLRDLGYVMERVKVGGRPSYGNYWTKNN